MRPTEYIDNLLEKAERRRREFHAWEDEHLAAGTLPQACLRCREFRHSDQTEPCFDADPALNPHCSRGL